ncbi:tetratricopeptide repeat protein [Eisenibacter elegans]|uniref:tetratricopeptide repeat protein n=1 Tax=Eisenibacter elegans TaxID=997 RepID=UPI001377E3E6|nr:tetratricopeptide repeat protein [Eisenibacter elegans]
MKWIPIALLLAIYTLVGANSAQAQVRLAVLPDNDPPVDSLEHSLARTEDPAQQARLLNQIASIKRFNNVPRSYEYIQKSLRIARQLQDDILLAQALYHIGNYFFDNNDHHKALHYYGRSFKLIEDKRHQDDLKAKIINELGSTNFRMGDYELALEYYHQSLSLYKQLKLAEGTIVTMTNIGSVYVANQHPQQALRYFNNALSSAEKLQDQGLMSRTLYHIGETYYDISSYDSAQVYFERSVLAGRRVANNAQLLSPLNRLAGLYLRRRDMDQALALYQEGLSLAKKSGESFAIAQALYNLGRAYWVAEQPDKATPYFQQSIKATLPTGDKELLRNNFYLLAKSFEKDKKDAEALQAYQQFMRYNDSLFHETRLSVVTEMNTRFNLEMKQQQQQYETQKSADTLQKRLLWSIVGLSLVGVVGLLIASGYMMVRQRQLAIDHHQHLQQKDNQLYQQQVRLERQREQIQEANLQYRHTLEQVGVFQQALLPAPALIRHYVDDFFVIRQAASSVSGDFYWMTATNDKIFAAVADCSGQSVSGALMSITGSALLNEIVRQQQVHSPAVILEELHQRLMQINAQQPHEAPAYIDLCLCMLEKADYDENKMILTFAGAKRPLYYVQHSQVTELKGTAQSVGLPNTTVSFDNRCIEVQRGSLLYLTSDGFTDEHNGDKGKAWFKELLRSELANLPLPKQKEALEQALRAYQQSAERPKDDTTVLAMML